MSLRFKNNKSKPLMLWCSSHSTLAKEEIPLYLEAGFRVLPLLTDFWTFEYRKSLDDEIISDWKESIDLPADVIDKIQAITFCEDFGRKPIPAETLALLNEHVDAIYLSVLPNLAIRLTELFDGSVVFRPFGHAELNTYSRITNAFERPASSLKPTANFVWCPILSTLQCAELRPMWTTPVHVGCFVTRDRLTMEDWRASETEAVVVETIPRINKQDYYRKIYDQYVGDHGSLPLRILGGNQQNGGELNDSRILGHLPDDDYHRAILTSRVCIYHGRSPYHVHYHPLEFMSVGVPVLFHSNSAIAWESRFAGYSEDFLESVGMYSTTETANAKAKQALEDVDYAEHLSQSQRFFMDSLFCRDKALHQAIWLKTVIISQINDTKRLVPLPAILLSEPIIPYQQPHVVEGTQESSHTGQPTTKWRTKVKHKLRSFRKHLKSRLRKAS